VTRLAGTEGTMANRNCLFCPELPSEADGEAHVMPQALVQNRLIFPPGFECEKCNKYMGANLIPVITHHSAVNHWIQWLGIPGRKGRPRESLGGVQRDEQTRRLRVPVTLTEPSPGAFVHEGRIFSVKPGPRYDETLMSRALHYIAFCHEVLNHVEEKGVSEGRKYGLGSNFDEVARYIRRPKDSKEFWPFAEFLLPRKRERRIGARGYKTDWGQLIQVEILGAMWMVAPMGPEELLKSSRFLSGRMFQIVTSPRAVGSEADGVTYEIEVDLYPDDQS